MNYEILKEQLKDLWPQNYSCLCDHEARNDKSHLIILKHWAEIKTHNIFKQLWESVDK